MSLTRNILTTLGARVALVGLGLVSSVVLARYLGPDGRGLFAQILLLPNLAIIVGLLGFDEAFAVYGGLARAKSGALLRQSMVLALSLGSLLALAGIAFVLAGAPGYSRILGAPKWLYVAALATVPVTLLHRYWQALVRGRNEILIFNGLEVGTKAVGTLFLVILVVIVGLGLPGAVLTNVMTDLSLLLVVGVILARLGAWRGLHADRELWLRTWRFAIPAWGATLTAYLNFRADEFVIVALLPPTQLGFYVVATSIVERIWILPGAVASALLPHLTSQGGGRNAEVSAQIARHVVGWTGLAALGLFLLSGWLIPFLYGQEFAASVAPLRWLLPGIVSSCYGLVLITEILAREKPRYGLIASGAATVVNIGANLYLIPRMGIAGAALASTLSYTLLSILMVRYFVRLTGVPITALIPRWSDRRLYGDLDKGGWRRWRGRS